MIDEINDLISDVSHKINDEACNYVMSMKLYSSQETEGDIEQRVRSVFTTKVHVSGVEAATDQQVLDSVKLAVTYTEDSPSPYMNTAENKNDARLIRKAISNLLSGREKVYKFDFTRGTHPFCPIMWEFSYCVVFKKHTLVIVGAASD